MLDARPVRPEEHPLDPLPRRLLVCAGQRPLALEDEAQLRSEGKASALSVLGLSGVQAQPATVEIDVVPPAGQDFGSHPPPGDVSDLDHRPNRFRQMRQQRVELLPLEETLPRHGLLEQRDVRLADDFLGDFPQA